MFRIPTTRRIVNGATHTTTTAASSQIRASTTAISNPTLKNIEKRWESMPVQEQAELWMALRDRMKAPWQELSLQEKKAAYWIAFGPHGPRAEPPPGEGKRVALGTTIGLVVSLVIFTATGIFSRPAPKTMTKEWQGASNEYLKAQKAEPFSGVGSKGYSGTGMIQSPAGKPT